MQVLLRTISAVDEDTGEQVEIRKIRCDFIQHYLKGSSLVEGPVQYTLHGRVVRVDGNDPQCFVSGDKRYRHSEKL